MDKIRGPTSWGCYVAQTRGRTEHLQRGLVDREPSINVSPAVNGFGMAGRAEASSGPVGGRAELWL